MLVALWGAKFTVLLLPVTAPTDCVCVMLCVVADAAALALTPALAEAAAAVGVTTAGLKTGIACILTSLTAQHLDKRTHQKRKPGHPWLKSNSILALAMQSPFFFLMLPFL